MPYSRQEKESIFAVIKSWEILPKLLLRVGREIPLWFVKCGIKGWAGIGLFLLSLVAFYHYRWQLRTFFMGSNDGFAESLAQVGRYFGDGITVAVMVAVLFVVGIVLKKRVFGEASLVLAVAGLYCGVLTIVGQFILAEARPESGGAMAFFMIGGHGISGHSSSSAVMFFPLYGTLGKKLNKPLRLAFGTILLFWAGMVAWSRMWDDKHFLWNVLLGSAIGFFAGYLTLNTWGRLSKEQSSANPN